ncbi:hypothetical protein [Glutamicibacter sp. 2E12]|uniref:hypothetical protein n=1 Tax=Glutamicibacter sp. 2E12 TaxID=3416181 RepID=UPI003CF8CD3A
MKNRRNEFGFTTSLSRPAIVSKNRRRSTEAEQDNNVDGVPENFNDFLKITHANTLSSETREKLARLEPKFKF